MIPTLHPYLKRGLDFDTSSIDPSDLIEEPHTEYHDAELQAAKRRRVEAIALRYLRGKPPVILTASLKGPFTRDWKNPWAKDVHKRTGGGSKSTSEQVERNRRGRSKAPQVPSPEASRAAGHAVEHMYSQTELEPLSATASVPKEDDTSSAAELLSIETDQPIANNSSSNLFWLRRPAALITLPETSQTDKSPTRSRSNRHTPVTWQSLRLAPPREPLGGRQLHKCARPLDEWLSSNSAPIDVLSPASSPAAVEHHALTQTSLGTSSSAHATSSSRLRADSAQEEEARSSQATQNAQITAAAETPISPLKDSAASFPQAQLAQPSYAQSFDTLVPATTYKASTTVQVPQSSPIQRATEYGNQKRSLGTEMQKSAERSVSVVPGSATRSQPSPAAHRHDNEAGVSKKPRHNLVTSPASASSTGFVYRRISRPKGEGSNTLEAKPRAAVPSSLSTFEKKGDGPPAGDKAALAPVLEDEAPEHNAFGALVEAVDANATTENRDSGAEKNGDEQYKGEQQESCRSKQSQYSTQAAMLLAQLEFQDDSPQSSTSSLTLRPWSQPAQNTPLPLLPQPSPAITPVSVFGARLDDPDDLTGDSIFHGPPISTQDLFNAASPFAFSTVKKRGDRSRRTSLRFSVASNPIESTTAKSFTPTTERTPLKEKNTAALWSFTSKNSSRCSQKLASRSPKHTTNDVELPQLDFHTSLGDFGPNVDIHFPECFPGLSNEP